jgi:ADP-ribose pyrophosphatase
MNLEEKTLHSELIFDGKIVHLYLDTVALPDGKTATREYIKHVGAVCVLALTDDNEIILERQYRYPMEREVIEIPAGKLDSADEDHQEAALRELREETGIVPREITYIGEFIGSPAILSERIYMFFARGLSFGDQKLDEDEFLDVFRMPLSTAVEKVLSGEIADGKTQAAVLKVYTMLKKEGYSL